MPTYLYCLRSDRADPPDRLTGVDGGAIYAIEASGLVAWVSGVAEKVTPTVDRVKAHDAVCAAALSAGETPLPIRFGQTFPDDAAAASGLALRESVLRARLERIAGCVELRLVVTRGPDPVTEQPAAETSELEAARAGVTSRDADGPGTAFLKRLARQGRADLAREVRCEEVRHAIRAAAKSLIVGQQPCESARGVSFFPVLVRRADVDAFRSAVAETLRLKAFGLSVLGPFPPYSFAGDA
jgi:hypothetical protein